MKHIKRFLPMMLAIVLVFGCCITASAAEPIYDMSIHKDNYSHINIDSYLEEYPYYICFTQGGYIHYYFSIVPFVCSYSDSPRYLYNQNADGCFYLRLNKSGTINQSSFDKYNIVGSFSSGDYSSVLIYGNHDIYSGDTLVFLTPPMPQIPIVQAAAGLPVIDQQQIQEITIIAVSCLVLLMGLLILRKKLPTFLRYSGRR